MIAILGSRTLASPRYNTSLSSGADSFKAKRTE